MVAVLDALELDDAILIGHSMGGPVVAEAAARAPSRVLGVVAVDAYQYFELPALEGTGVEITSLAQGVPVGGELDYLDDGTISAALTARKRM